MSEWTILTAVSGLAGLVTTLLCMRPLLHLSQLESYQLPGYWRAVRRIGWKVWVPGLVMAAVNGVLIFGLGWVVFGVRGWMLGLLTLLDFACAGYLFFERRKQPVKKALVWTQRAKRLAWATAVIVLLGATGMALIHPLLGLVWPALAPVWMLLAAWVVQPLEARVNRGFFRDAQRILRERPGLIRIGITGSYGKTSTKFLLATLLAEHYTVLATPSSFNTPMGVTRVIREQLQPEHEVFIAEMGARHVGDIREMCELVHPTIGLLTSVGPQHLETFGNIERVTATKYELIEALPQDGAAFFARDDNICERLFARCPLREKHLAGEHLRAENVEVGPFGSRFVLVHAQGERIECQTKLLGAHNIQNLLLCCEVALHLGLTLPELSAGIAKLQPVEHRLQLIDSGNGITVIDDAFNSNPAGAKAALDVLGRFPPRRIVITPGMVELGAQQDALNKTFGRQMADCADIVILVGKRRTGPIVEGLRAGNFPEGSLHIVSSLAESTAKLGSLVRAGDTVLYENDLPENYAE